jgi:hypothetical protein
MVVIKIGQFLRVLDDDGHISLTNLSMYISLYKLLIAPSAGYGEIGAFLLAAATYSYKKALNGNGSNGTPK